MPKKRMINILCMLRIGLCLFVAYQIFLSSKSEMTFQDVNVKVGERYTLGEDIFLYVSLYTTYTSLVKGSVVEVVSFSKIGDMVYLKLLEEGEIEHIKKKGYCPPVSKVLKDNNSDTFPISLSNTAWIKKSQ
ncbi:hypothetical protein KJ603_01735 [Patescibacteria group bacterium]|nr:hypothetical protein [Patescibacteria group bacterium]